MATAQAPHRTDIYASVAAMPQEIRIAVVRRQRQATRQVTHPAEDRVPAAAVPALAAATMVVRQAVLHRQDEVVAAATLVGLQVVPQAVRLVAVASEAVPAAVAALAVVALAPAVAAVAAVVVTSVAEEGSHACVKLKVKS